ncbi:hypothetical protein SNE40_016402 [Patella caerulea]|uniref:Uncharacterized protein n=1 Tax=Patella caerulea TaxID=87958 RepID=A0AAN8JD73_PATCE
MGFLDSFITGLYKPNQRIPRPQAVSSTSSSKLLNGLLNLISVKEAVNLSTYIPAYTKENIEKKTNKTRTGEFFVGIPPSLRTHTMPNKDMMILTIRRNMCCEFKRSLVLRSQGNPLECTASI